MSAGVERLAELVQALAAQGESRGHAMPAEASEMAGTALQGRVQVEAGNAAPRPLGVIALERQQDGGAAVTLDNARGHDADNAGMPAFPRQDQSVIAVQIERFLDLFGRLLEN